MHYLTLMIHPTLFIFKLSDYLAAKTGTALALILTFFVNCCFSSMQMKTMMFLYFVKSAICCYNMLNVVVSIIILFQIVPFFSTVCKYYIVIS